MQDIFKLQLIEEFTSQEHLKEPTKKAYYLDLIQFKSYLKENSNQSLEDCLEAFICGLKGETNSNLRKKATLNSYFNFLQSKSIIKLHPLKALNINIKRGKYIDFKPLSDEELICFNSYINTYINNTQEKILFLLTLETGLKNTNMLNLTIDNFNLPYLQINSQKILLSDKLVKLLKEHMQTLSGNIIFINRLKNVLTAQSLRNLFLRINKELHTNYLHEHLRDTYFKKCFANKINLNTLSLQVNLSVKTLLEKEKIYLESIK